VRATLDFQKKLGPLQDNGRIRATVEGDPETVTELIQLTRSFMKEKKWIEE
jgi:hypothetical protein